MAKHAVARRGEKSKADLTIVARGTVARAVERLDLVEQKMEAVLVQSTADVDRLDQKLDQLREVLVNGTGATDEREQFFLRRLRAMEAYGRGESTPDESWVERDLAAEVPRGALAVASAWGISRTLIEQVYAQYQAAYEAAFKRWREKYPDGVRACDRCFACGQSMPEKRPNPLPKMEPR